MTVCYRYFGCGHAQSSPSMLVGLLPSFVRTLKMFLVALGYQVQVSLMVTQVLDAAGASKVSVADSLAPYSSMQIPFFSP